jgi:hypothetical protein
MKDDPGNHLNRIYKLSSIDDLMKGFGINQNKPRSQRGESNAVMPSLPPPPRSSRHDKYKEYVFFTPERPTYTDWNLSISPSMRSRRIIICSEENSLPSTEQTI